MNFSIAALLAVASASKSSFPSFDSFHAHCELQTVFEAPCDSVLSSLETTATTFTDPASGLYELKEDSAADYFWVTRTTPVKKYVDDILFQTEGASVNGGCKITAKSRSQTLSYYDYETNYCNMYNVFRASGVTFGTVATPSCKWVPTPADLLATCDKY